MLALNELQAENDFVSFCSQVWDRPLVLVECPAYVLYWSFMATLMDCRGSVMSSNRASELTGQPKHKPLNSIILMLTSL